MQQFYKYLILALLILHVSSIKSKTASLWVGESTTFVTDKIETPIGWDNIITSGFVWNIPESTKQYISMGTSAMNWNTVTLNKFFTGSKYITCTIYYQGVRIRHGTQEFSDLRNKEQRFYVKCNTVDIELYPVSMDLNIGDSQNIQYRLTPTSSTPPTTVTFFSSNPQVAEVDFKGNVYAKGIGSATITAKTNFETSATCEVKVNPVQATSIQIEPMSIKMHIGESEKLKATVLPTHTSDKSIAWTSSDENIVSVDPEGKITAKSQGHAQILASTLDGSELSAYCDVTVEALAETITLNTSSKKIGIGESFILIAHVLPEGASSDVLWKSSNPSVAYVDKTGKVEGFETGTVVITATTTDGTNLSASCEVSVIRYVTSITLNENNLTMNVGEQKTITATVNPSDATEQNLSWQSMDKDIVNVNNGRVAALKNGVVSVIVSATDGSNIQAICTITVETPVSSINLNYQKLDMYIGDFKPLQATILPENATHKDLVWESSDPTIADVQNGIVLAYKEGTALITASATDKSGTTTSCRVTVSKPSNIKTSPLSPPYVFTKNNMIIIENVPYNTVCKVYQINGMQMYNTYSKGERISFSTNSNGIYIVIIGTKVYKVLVNDIL